MRAIHDLRVRGDSLELDRVIPYLSGSRPLLFKNDGFGGNWLDVVCLTDRDGDATDPFLEDDRDAIGAKVEVDRDATPDWDYSQGAVTLQVLDGTSGRSSGNTPWLLRPRERGRGARPRHLPRRQRRAVHGGLGEPEDRRARPPLSPHVAKAGAAWGLAAAIAWSCAGCATPESPASGRLAGVRLHVGAESVAPARIVSPARQEVLVGARRLGVRQGEIQAFARGERGSEAAAWTATVPGGEQVWRVTGAGDRGYVLTYEVDAKSEFTRWDPTPTARVLDLAKGTWLPGLRPAGAAGERPRLERIAAVEASGDEVVLVSLWGEPDPERLSEKLTHYQVDAFGAGGKPTWSRRFAMAAPREYDGVYLWGIPGPRYPASELRLVTFLDDTVLVCAEARQPLLFLSRASGRTVREVERVWEFERGFIGPSVFSHYLGRFGLETFASLEPPAEKVAEARARFDERTTASLIAGPIVAPLTVPRDGDDYSIFVVAAKAPARQLGSYVAEGCVYELNEQGEVLSTATLPQMLGGGATPLAGGAIFRGANETFVRLAAARQAPRVEMGGGGPDCTTRIDWLAQGRAAPVDAWLTAGRAGDPVAFGERHAFSVPRGGFVREGAKDVYSFPLEATSLADGTSQALRLDVPLDYDVTPPASNVSREGKTISTRSPYLLSVTGLAARGRTLAVTLGRDDGADILEFDLDATPLFAGAFADPEAERREAAARRVRALPGVNRRDEHGHTPLFDAVEAHDLDYLEALLRAGANPRLTSNAGWTPLRYAATYGSAKAVERLLRAGADARERDKDGLSVPVYAAGSFRKMRALLDAGADPNAASEGGWTPLMSAAQRGEITVVELLLARGASVAAKSKEGKTALDLARESTEGGHAEVVRVLEAAARTK